MQSGELLGCILWENYRLSSAGLGWWRCPVQIKETAHRAPCRVTCNVCAAVPDGFISQNQGTPGWKRLPAVSWSWMLHGMFGEKAL